MTKDEMVHLLQTNVQKWNRWREETEEAWSELDGVDLTAVNLSRANLRGMNLSSTDFRFAILHGTDFEGSLLNDVRFNDADLEGANLRVTDLTLAVFGSGSLDGTDFTGATVFNTVFADMDFRGVVGLEQLDHLGPCEISLSTLYRSEGKLSESFLRATGVPDGLITQIPSLISAQAGIQFYSCFISYSHRDEDFTRRLHSRMRDAKLRVWYAPEDIQGGKKLHEQIETAIRVYDKLLVVLSEASLTSEWVKTEIRNARRGEKATGKRKLFPVRLVDMETIRNWHEFDADSGKDLGVELREYYIPDFSNWKDHDKFEAEFTKLLRDLKADAPPPA